MARTGARPGHRRAARRAGGARAGGRWRRRTVVRRSMSMVMPPTLGSGERGVFQESDRCVAGEASYLLAHVRLARVAGKHRTYLPARRRRVRPAGAAARPGRASSGRSPTANIVRRRSWRSLTPRSAATSVTRADGRLNRRAAATTSGSGAARRRKHRLGQHAEPPDGLGLGHQLAQPGTSLAPRGKTHRRAGRRPRRRAGRAPHQRCPGADGCPATGAPTGSTTRGPVSAPTTIRPLSPNHMRSTHPSGTTRCGWVRARSFTHRQATSGFRPMGDAYSRYDAAIRQR